MQELDDPSEVQACIMEAISYIQHGRIVDNPPCVSSAITGLMIERNDNVGVVERQALKRLVPDIIHTAPTHVDVSKRVVTFTFDPAYVKAEEERYKIIKDFEDKHDRSIESIIPGLSVRQFNKLIRDLANVAKFE
jgi:hypothetical protein